MIDKKKICVATIVAPHGIKGDVKIKSHTVNKDDIFKFKNLFDCNNTVLNIIKKSVAKDKMIIHIDGIDDRNHSENLVGKDIFTNRVDFPDIDSGEFYYEDLIGIEVVDRHGKVLGNVRAIHNFGAGDIIEINFIDNKIKENMFLFNKDYFPDVNFKKGKITFTPII